MRARRLLVEAAWHHRRRYSVGKTMRDRWDLAPAAARARGDEGNRRLQPASSRAIATLAIGLWQRLERPAQQL